MLGLEIKSAVVSEHSDECGKDKQGAAGAVLRVVCIRRIGGGLGRTGVSWCKGLLEDFTN